MFINSKLTEQDFINANFVLLYSKVSVKIITGIILFFLVISILTAAFLSDVSFSGIIVPIVMLTVMPLFIYIGAKRNFTTNKRISETIEYHFDNDYLSMKGESFSSQLTWEKVYKVTQTKNWVLIWQSRQTANPIPKRDIRAEQIISLKAILDSHKVKNNL